MKNTFFISKRKNLFETNFFGEYKLYHENGELNIICTYINGKIEGEFKSYYSNGQFVTIILTYIY